MSPIVMYQQWRHLVFLHWRFDPSVVRATLPPGFEVDTHEGVAYVGIVLIDVHGVRPRFLPAMPVVSHFCQMNVRTYVSVEGERGVWF
jgi:uncharacterized protein